MVFVLWRRRIIQILQCIVIANSIYSFRKVSKTVCLVAAAAHSDYVLFFMRCTNTVSVTYLLSYCLAYDGSLTTYCLYYRSRLC